MTISYRRGRPQPLGAVFHADGINFAVFSRHATSITLVVMPEKSRTPIIEYRLDPKRNRTGDIWHVLVSGLPSVFRYGYRVDGPIGPRHRFNPSRILIDPASTVLSDGDIWAGTCQTDPHRTSRLSLYQRRPYYEWGDDAPPRTPLEDTVIYELHVRGFSIHPSACVAAPGTFAGLVEKIPYLKDLGITAVELLPVHEFDECDCPFTDPVTGENLVNFWGYNTVSFAAPKAAFASNGASHGQLAEFRDMVKAFHLAGIEIYLDVVFNHTGEGGDAGRTYNFRGLDNDVYYLLDDRGRYLNYTGCGNTVNCNHPVVRDIMMTCLRYWVGDMHIDGFRFDLASVLGRDRLGNVSPEPPVLEQIADDGVLADAKLIAEPWDAVGLYQMGRFPYGRRWSEWNGPYRDDVRKFWKGDAGAVSPLATRICGSADLFQKTGRLPRHTINFITCHDGFTLADLVTYNHKHNERNGEENRDGTDANFSWNCGAEGPTSDPRIRALRHRQVRNLFATLMISQGVPMILAGDEFLRTQQGNNNAWCQDNEIGWVNWTLDDDRAAFHRFAKEMIWLRRRHPVLRRRRFLAGGNIGDIRWHGHVPFEPNFGTESRTIAFTLDGRNTGREDDLDYQPDCDIYVVMSNDYHPTRVKVPPAPSGRRWFKVVETAAAEPHDFIPEGEGLMVHPGMMLELPSFSMVILVSER